MGNKHVSRKDFFKSLRKQKAGVADIDVDTFPGNEDPLFEKYSRKTITPRVYKTEVVPFNEVGNDEAGSMLRVGNVTSGLAPYAGVWTEWEVLHLMRRMGYGNKKSIADALLPLTPSAAVDLLMSIDNNPPAPPINYYQNITADSGGVPYGSTWIDSFFPTNINNESTTNARRITAMRYWLFGQAIENNTIREKMTWFWYHFIPVDFDDIDNSSNSYISYNSARVFYSFFKLYRDNCLGNFKTFTRKMCTEPAMMFYLNNQKNTKTAPDENFARELMELFTFGKSPDNVPYYSQADVVEAAKVLTGWRVEGLNTANFVTNFVPSVHHTSNKQFSTFFSNNGTAPVINYQAGAAGANELDLFLDLIFGKSKIVSEYICRRLYRYFIYYDIDANIESNVIVPLAQTFVASNWEILPVLNQLFKSEHFFDMANRGVFIKSPFDMVIGALKTFNMNTTTATATNYESQYRLWGYFNDTICSPMDQRMGTIPNVSGWVPYYQTPAFHQFWINSNTIQKRFSFLDRILTGFNLTYATETTRIEAVAIDWAAQFGNLIAADPNLLVAKTIQYLLPLDLSTTQKNTIKQQTLLTGQTTDNYWTTAWNTYTANPTNTTNTNQVKSRVKSLILTIVQYAEYQLS